MFHSKTNFFTYILFLSIALSGCGGGGGSGGGKTTKNLTPSVVYEGIETAAVITSENAQTLAEGAYNGAKPGQALSIVEVGTESSGSNSGSGIQAILRSVQTITNQLTAANTSSSENISSQETVTDTIQGECNGFPQGSPSSYTVDFDNATGNFVGQIRMTNFTGCAGALNGIANVEGHIDPFGDIDDVTLEFGTLTYTDLPIDWSLSGTIDYVEPTFDNYIITMNFTIEDSDGTLYKLENYVVDYQGNGPSADVTVSGNYYHQDYGYVSIQTNTADTPMTLTYVSDYPTRGNLVLTGGDGGNGPTSLSIIYIFDGDYHYDMELHSDDDGEFDGQFICDWISICTYIPVRVSQHGEEFSHNAGMNCMNCHFGGPSEPPTFSIAGTVYQTDNLDQVNPNTTIRLTTAAFGAGEVIADIQVDGLGNFYSTRPIDWGTSGLYASVTGNAGTNYMNSLVSQGDCNSCHDNVTTPRIYAD